MFDYQFGKSLNQYDWNSGTFQETKPPVESYQSGFASGSLGLTNQPDDAPRANPNPHTAIPRSQRKKKPKLLLWLLLSLALIGLGFGLYKLIR